MRTKPAPLLLQRATAWHVALCFALVAAPAAAHGPGGHGAGSASHHANAATQAYTLASHLRLSDAADGSLQVGLRTVLRQPLSQALPAKPTAPRDRAAMAAAVKTAADGLVQQYGAATVVQVDGTPMVGSWTVADTPHHGTITPDGAQLIAVASFTPTTAPTADAVRLSWTTTLWPDATPGLSASALAKAPWQITSDSAAAFLATTGSYNGSDPAFWTTDPALRTITVAARRPRPQP